MKFIRKFIQRPLKKKEDLDFSSIIRKITGLKPLNISLYTEAFIHSSYNQCNTNTGQRINFERLEFLGDAMLSAIVAVYFYKKVPNKDEGYLTQMRSKIVSRSHLNRLGKDLDLIKFVKSSTHKSMFGDNIHGNIFEALVGAVYLDRGFADCEKFVRSRVLSDDSDFTELEGKIASYKSLIINWCQKSKKNINFDFKHDLEKKKKDKFSVRLKIDGVVVSKGEATSKKKAEELASRNAYQIFKKDIDQML